MTKRKNERGEIMLCCIILIVVVCIFVFMALMCVGSAAVIGSIGQKDSPEKVVAVKTPVTTDNTPETVETKGVRGKLQRGEIFSLISALIAVASGLAAVAVVPGRKIRVVLVITLFSLAASLFFW